MAEIETSWQNASLALCGAGGYVVERREAAATVSAKARRYT
jgi:hypothetical protein